MNDERIIGLTLCTENLYSYKAQQSMKSQSRIYTAHNAQSVNVAITTSETDNFRTSNLVELHGARGPCSKLQC